MTSAQLLLLSPLPLAALVLETAGRRWTTTRSCSLALAAGIVAMLGLASCASTGQQHPSSALVRITWLGLVVDLSALVVGLTVLSYARRNLAFDPSGRRFASATALVLGGTIVATSGARLSVLCLGWVLTSIGAVAAFAGGGTRRTRNRMALVLGLGDLALLLALGILWWACGDASLSSLAGTEHALNHHVLTLGPIGVHLGAVVAVLMVLAVAARAGQAPLPGWLPSTVEASTPTSALLHAGVVNAGGYLLVVATPLTVASRAGDALLIAIASLSVVLGAAAARHRPDRKGQLAISTVAQMGFMLLSIGVGAPAVAIAHLVGHAQYKSSRFLGAGGAVELATTERRFARPASLGQVPAMASALVSGAIVAAGAWWVLGPAASRADHVLGAGASFMIAATATWAVLAGGAQGSLRRRLLGAVVVGVGVDALLSRAIAESTSLHLGTTGVSLAAGLGALAVLGIAVHVGGRVPATAPVVTASLAGFQAPIGTVAVPRRTPARPTSRLEVPPARAEVLA